MTFKEFYGSLSAKERKQLAKRLKDRLEQYVAETLKGGIATAKFYAQNGYAEGFISVYATDRRIAKVRVYANGDCYAYDLDNGRLHRHACHDWNELSN